MEETYEKMNGSEFLEEMLEMSRSGIKTEAMTLIQSKKDEITNRDVISKNGRRKYTKLQNLLLEIEADETFENHAGHSNNNVSDRPLQSDSGNNSQANPINNNTPDIQIVTPTVLPSASQPNGHKPMSNFLLCLKTHLDLIEKIGKRPVLNLLHEKIYDIKTIKANGYEQEIHRHKRIINIISKEDQEDFSWGINKSATLSNIRYKRNPKKGCKKTKQEKVQITNSRATANLPNEPNIKTEPTNTIKNTGQNIIAIVKTESWSNQLRVKQEVIEID